MNILKPRLGSIDQGSIFSCARALRYENSAVYGIVLTARCDIVQEKFPVLNYIPIVTLDDWLQCDGAEILKTRAISDTESRLHSSMTAVDVAISLLNSQTPHDILMNIFMAESAVPKIKKGLPKFAEIVSKIVFLEDFEISSTEHIKKLYIENASLSRAVLKELVYHKLSGYYFFEQVTEGGSKDGFVALLREVANIPRVLAKKISEGIDKDDQLFQDLPHLTQLLNFKHETFAMPLGEVPSPQLEHFMQVFSNLFGRIGIEDLDEDYANNIVIRQPR